MHRHARTDQTDDTVGGVVLLANGRRPLVAVGVAVAVWVLAEVAVRLLLGGQPAPLRHADEITQVRAEALPDRQGTDVLFAGTSMAWQGFVPSTFSAADPEGRSAFNVGLDAAVPPVTGAWLQDQVVPQVRPSTVVWGLSTLDFAPAFGDGPLEAWEHSPEGRPGALGAIERLVARHSELVRRRGQLRRPSTLFGAAAEAARAARVEAEAVTGPDGERLRFDSSRTAEQAAVQRARLEDWSPDRADVEAVVATALALADEGVALVIAELPVPPAFVALHPGGDGDVARARMLMRSVSERLGVTFLPASSGWSDEDFVDFTHLTAAGASRYTREVAAQLGGPRQVGVASTGARARGLGSPSAGPDPDPSAQGTAEDVDAAAAGTTRPVRSAPSTLPSQQPTSGPSTSGPSTSGPSTSGPSTSGPSTSGPSTSGPSASGPSTSGPSTGAPAADAAPPPAAPGTAGGNPPPAGAGGSQTPADPPAATAPPPQPGPAPAPPPPAPAPAPAQTQPTPTRTVRDWIGSDAARALTDVVQAAAISQVGCGGARPAPDRAATARQGAADTPVATQVGRVLDSADGLAGACTGEPAWQGAMAAHLTAIEDLVVALEEAVGTARTQQGATRSAVGGASSRDLAVYAAQAHDRLRWLVDGAVNPRLERNPVWWSFAQRGHLDALLRAREEGRRIDTVVLGTSQARTGILADLVSASSGRPTFNAGVDAATVDATAVWARRVVMGAAQPARVALLVSGVDLLTSTGPPCSVVARDSLTASLDTLEASFRVPWLSGLDPRRLASASDTAAPPPLRSPLDVGYRDMAEQDYPQRSREDQLRSGRVYLAAYEQFQPCTGRFEALSTLVSDLSGRGVDVLVVSAPVRSELRDVAPAGRIEDLDARIAQISRDAGGRYASLTTFLDDAEMVDLVHASQAGAQRLSQQLAVELDAAQ